MAIEEQVSAQEFRPPPEEEGPPVRGLSPLEWTRENLFRTWYDSLITLILAPIIAWIIYRGLRFVFFTGRWEIVEVNLTNFMVGRFPRAELWRLWVATFVLCIVVGVALGAMSRATRLAAEAKGVAIDQPWHELVRRGTPLALLILVFAVFVRTVTPLALLAAAIVLTLGAFQIGKRLPQEWRRWVNLAVVLGLVISYQVIVGFDGVLWDRWGGFLLNVFFSVGGIALSFPLGVLLALGRRSSLPAVRIVCVAYIEFFRGIPLIALLFMSWLLLGFFLPPDFFTPDRVLRAMVAFILFTAAYVAEIVRGGLQSVPRAQYEAAVAVGLPPWKVTRLIVLPQALRNVIPALVGQFISLFKDTTLVFVIALLDLLRVARNVTQQPGFLGQGLHAEALAFITFIFWVGCYWMSRESQRLEKRLGVGER